MFACEAHCIWIIIKRKFIHKITT